MTPEGKPQPHETAERILRQCSDALKAFRPHVETRKDAIEHVVWAVAALREMESDLVGVLGQETLRSIKPGMNPDVGRSFLEAAIDEARAHIRSMTGEWRQS